MLSYVGRKANFVRNLLWFLKNRGLTFDRVIEPFGGSLELSKGAVTSGLAKRAEIAERDPNILNIYRAAKNAPETLKKGVGKVFRSLEEGKLSPKNIQALHELARRQVGGEYEQAARDYAVSALARRRPFTTPQFLPGTQVPSIQRINEDIEKLHETLRKSSIYKDWPGPMVMPFSGKYHVSPSSLLYVDPPYYGTFEYATTLPSHSREALYRAMATLKGEPRLGVMFESKAGASALPSFKWRSRKSGEAVTGFGRIFESGLGDVWKTVDDFLGLLSIY